MSILSHPLTYTDLEREREIRDERLELIEGEIVVTPAPAPLHLVIAHRLAVLIDQAIGSASFGVIMQSPDVYFADQSVLQPDLAILLRDRKERFGPRRIDGAPNLAIEILSPSTRARDQGIKRDTYARHGVPEYWIVDPDAQAITIFSDPRDGRYHSELVRVDVAVSVTIPGVSVDLKTLFVPAFGD